MDSVGASVGASSSSSVSTSVFSSGLSFGSETSITSNSINPTIKDRFDLLRAIIHFQYKETTEEIRKKHKELDPSAPNYAIEIAKYSAQIKKIYDAFLIFSSIISYWYADTFEDQNNIVSSWINTGLTQEDINSCIKNFFPKLKQFQLICKLFDHEINFSNHTYNEYSSEIEPIDFMNTYNYDPATPELNKENKIPYYYSKIITAQVEKKYSLIWEYVSIIETQ